MGGLITEEHTQDSFSPYGQRKISVPTELPLGRLRSHLRGVPPQPNSPTETVFEQGIGRPEDATDTGIDEHHRL